MLSFGRSRRFEQSTALGRCNAPCFVSTHSAAHLEIQCKINEFIELRCSIASTHYYPNAASRAHKASTHAIAPDDSMQARLPPTALQTAASPTVSRLPPQQPQAQAPCRATACGRPAAAASTSSPSLMFKKQARHALLQSLAPRPSLLLNSSPAGKLLLLLLLPPPLHVFSCRTHWPPACSPTTAPTPAPHPVIQAATAGTVRVA